jgi:hypothetical protein
MRRAALACLRLRKARAFGTAEHAHAPPPDRERTGLFGFSALQEPEDWDAFARSSIARCAHGDCPCLRCLARPGRGYASTQAALVLQMLQPVVADCEACQVR